MSRPQGDDARHGSDRPLLHANAARAAQPRPRRTSSTRAPRSARGRSRRAEGVPEWTTDLEAGDRAPRDRHGRDRAAEPPARGGGRALREARQGRALHEAARAHRRGGEADPRHGRARRRLRRLPRGPRLHAEDAEGGRRRCRRARSATSRGRARARRIPGPHSAWFWDAEQAGGGPIVDLGCHCIEIIRNYIGKDNRPVEVMCWADTLVHPIEAEDNAIALIRFESRRDRPVRGVSWTFRGGMDLRDEVAGTEGTIWLEPLPAHRLRGVHARASGGGYVAEKAETASGWLFPVGDEVARARLRRHVHRHVRRDRRGPRADARRFYDGYVVNAIIDACYRSAESRQWEPVAARGLARRPARRGSRARAASTTARR